MLLNFDSFTYWSFSKYGGEFSLSGNKNANWTVVAIAGGSSLETFTSSATTVKSTGSPMCVIAAISSKGLRRKISPKEHKVEVHELFLILLP